MLRSREFLAAGAALAAVIGTSPAHGSSQAAAEQVAGDSAGVRAAVTEFLAAFNGLDNARFNALVASDASVFFPQHPFPIRRASGKQEVTEWFNRFFDAQRKRRSSLSIEPRDLEIQTSGDAALVTFHLGQSEEAAGRRTLVFKREEGAWKLWHLHASSLRIPKDDEE